MRHRLLILLALVCAAALFSAAAAYAAFTSGDSAAQSVSTNTLQPPTNLQGTVASSCKKVTLTWTGSASAFATGYTIQRNGTTVATVAVGTTTYADSSVSKTTAYTYTVLTTFQQWSAGTTINVNTC
jgi:hypothetical protein